MIRRSSSLVLHFFATTPGSLLVSAYTTTFWSIEYSNSLKAELHNCDGWETKQKKKNHTGQLRRSNLISLHDVTLSVYNPSFGLSAVILPISSNWASIPHWNCTSAFTVHTRLLAKAHLHFAHLLFMSFLQKSRALLTTTLLWHHRGGWIHVVISKNENIRELFLSLECNRHTCLRWTLLAGKKFSLPCSICALLDTQHTTKTSHFLLLEIFQEQAVDQVTTVAVPAVLSQVTTFANTYCICCIHPICVKQIQTIPNTLSL